MLYLTALICLLLLALITSAIHILIEIKKIPKKISIMLAEVLLSKINALEGALERIKDGLDKR